MTNAPDFRSDPSESPEGRGIAYGRSAAFWKSLPDTVRAEVTQEATLTVGSIEDYPVFVRDQVTKTVVEDAELIGFWVAWHKAGGFGGLEAGFHDLRRLNATTLVVEGIDVKTAQTRLGHADPRVTLSIYASAPASVDRAAAEVVGERFFGGHDDGDGA